MQIKLPSLLMLGLSTLFSQTLVELNTIGLKKSYKLKSFDYQVQSQHYNTKQAKDQYFPTLNINLQYGKDKYEYHYPSRKIKYNNNITAYSINLSQPIYEPQILSMIKDSELKLNYTKIQKAQYKQALLKEISTAYIDAITYKKMLNIYILRENNYYNIKETISKKLQVRLATIPDYYQSNANYIAAKNDTIHTKLYLNNLIKKLLYLTHTEVKIPRSKITDKIDEILAAKTFDESNINNNPTLKLYKTNVKIAKNQISYKKDQTMPTVGLSASYSDTHSSDSITKRNESRITLNVNIPVFNKPKNDAIDAAKELYQSAKFDYLDQLNNIKISLQETISNIKQYIQIIKKDKEVITSRKKFLDKQKIGYNNKLISLTDLYDAQNDYFNALLQFEKDKGELLKNYIAYLNLKGDLTLKSIKQIQILIKDDNGNN